MSIREIDNEQAIDSPNYHEARLNLMVFFSEPINKVITFQESLFDETLKPCSGKLVLFGIGNLGRWITRELMRRGIKPVALSDNNPALWGKNVEGVKIFSPKECAEKFSRSAVFIVTIWGAESGHRFLDSKNRLEAVGCQRIMSFIPLFWKFSSSFLPYYSLALPSQIWGWQEEILNGLTVWHDDISIKEYSSHLKFRYQLDYKGLLRPAKNEQYFPNGLFKPSSKEVFVDCGAFDGDTIRSFLSHCQDSFEQIVALEPDPINYKKLITYIDRLKDDIKRKIVVHGLAAGNRQKKVRIEATGTPSTTVGSGNMQIMCETLDTLLEDSNPTFIKMDIEGHEIEALLGATKTIKDYRPILAISVYHCPDHLWTIPLFVNSLGLDYKLFLRSHGEECWDLVCYAVPPERLAG